LIIGATSELAQAIVQKYAEEGWKLTLAALEEDQLPEVVSRAERAGARVDSTAIDATDFASHPAFYDALPDDPDLIICCFGYLGDHVTACADFEEVRKIIDINLNGMVSLLNIAAARFEERGHGAIAAISSVAGERGKHGVYLYGSAKAALTAYLSGLRARLVNAGVHVMTNIPGFCNTRSVDTSKVPSSVVAEPRQVADAVYHGLEKKRDVIYVLPIWRWIMSVVRHLPEPVFQRLSYTRFYY
jgi:short-subunit dehydrogenase